MKPVLAVATLALGWLIFQDEARQAAGETQDVYDDLAARACKAKVALTEKVRQRPLISLLVAAGLGFILASILPKKG